MIKSTWVALVLVLAACAPNPVEEPTPPAVEPGPARSLPETEVWDPVRGWYEGAPAPLAAPSAKWRAKADSSAVHGWLIVAVADGVARRLDVATGAPLWEVAAPPGAKVSVVDDVAVLTADTTVVLDGATGAELWRGPADDVDTAPGLLLVRGAAGTIALDRKTLVRRWTSPVRVSESEGVLWGGTGNQWHVVSAVTGAAEWGVLRAPGSHVVVTKHRMIVFSGERGEITQAQAFAVGSGSAEWRLTVPALHEARFEAVVIDSTWAVMKDDGVAITFDPAGGHTHRSGLSRGEPVPLRVDSAARVIERLLDQVYLCPPAADRQECPTATVPRDSTSVDAGGVRYVRAGESVYAVRHSDLGVQWTATAPVGGDLVPIPGGFLLTGPELVAHL
ncbi:PQQ-binding-like beta-propeller repeat protein [Actinosynnema sp. NPDC020468]|uniref:outer membrane protein assembly factor BamB family protein n=1 Tax=Actinosynnema sp. NPDC020468 TaxID=3154488 RepID=UPI0033D63B60